MGALFGRPFVKKIFCFTEKIDVKTSIFYLPTQFRKFNALVSGLSFMASTVCVENLHSLRLEVLSPVTMPYPSDMLE